MSMHAGPSKYDKHALRIMREELATGVVVIVLDGKRGHGVAVKVGGRSREDAMARHRQMPAILRILADSMDATQEEALGAGEAWADIEEPKS